MGSQKFRTVSKRPLIILTVVFIIIVVIVGAVTWKVTKDAYEGSSTNAEAAQGTTGGDNGQSGEEITTPVPTYSLQELEEKPWLSLRMTRDVLPVHYDIVMYPDFYGNHGEFYGNETVEIQVKKPTKYFLIHIHTTYLNVTNTQIFDNGTGEEIVVEHTFYYAPNEFFVIEAGRSVDKAVQLKLQFEGTLTKAIVGIYKSTYIDTRTNETRNIASSKFEPTYARQAFPCFDEPNIKAEYTITLVHKPEYIALSNMPEKSKIRVFATPDKINQTRYSLEMAKHTLDYYEDLFEMEYPLPKLDMIAIPDFVSGAMEHWGLITYRESRLLYDAAEASNHNKETVAMVVAHEMAHQWFGNIVTMDWWNDLWLNEGFASSMEFIGVSSKETDWDMENQALVKNFYRAMDDDSVISSHPIIVNVNNPSQITSVFDAISYYKGSSVIRMLEHIMTKDKFFKGIAKYLKKFQWQNAKTDDLWEVLSTVEGSGNVKEIMDTWTLQDGFPFINISIETAPSGTSTIRATQKRFLANPDVRVNQKASPFGYKWYISLDYKSSSGVNGTKIMENKDITFTENLGLSSNSSWVKFNHEQYGFLRVLYPDTMWHSFIDHLTVTLYENFNLSTADRAGLLNDAFTLAAADLMSYEIPLKMMSYLAKERKYVPWRSALNGGINFISDNFESDPNFGYWKKFLADQIGPAIRNLGFNDTGSHDERKLRSSLLGVAGYVEEPTTIANIISQWRNWLDNGVAPSVNLRRSVYKYGMIHSSSDSDWEKVWQKYKVESSPQEKELLAFSLCYARQPHLIARLLDFAKREEGIKRQDFFTVVTHVGNNIAARGIVWNWARENYQFFVDKFTVTDRQFGRMLYNMVRKYSTEFSLQEVKKFFAQYPNAGAGERYRKMALESIEQNIQWMKTYKSVVLEWLKKNA